ncbi:hypothetical protein D3C87_1128750 [compost metagenome]
MVCCQTTSVSAFPNSCSSEATRWVECWSMMAPKRGKLTPVGEAGCPMAMTLSGRYLPESSMAARVDSLASSSAAGVSAAGWPRAAMRRSSSARTRRVAASSCAAGKTYSVLVSPSLRAVMAAAWAKMPTSRDSSRAVTARPKGSITSPSRDS